MNPPLLAVALLVTVADAAAAPPTVNRSNAALGARDVPDAINRGMMADAFMDQREALCGREALLFYFDVTPLKQSATSPISRELPTTNAKPQTNRPRVHTVEFLPPPSIREKKILLALEEPTKFEFADTALSDVVDYIKQKHQIEVQLDNKGLADAAVDPSAPITRSVDGIGLRSALRLILEDLDLMYVVQGEVLKITSKADVTFTTRVYPVGDLARTEAGEDDFDSLVEAIVNGVDPTSWDASDGPGTASVVPTAKCLVVYQTYAVHDEVLQLLRALRMGRELLEEKPGLDRATSAREHLRRLWNQGFGR
jgi:hypothetical protein